MEQTVSIIVTGKVQGVYYRQSTKEKALELGLTGHVRNKEDGTVEIETTGTAENIEKLVEWCHHGPSRAVVTEVSTVALPYKKFESFKIDRG